MLMRWVTTSPVNEPSERISRRSLAITLPWTLPMTTTSRALRLAATTPCLPTVTRVALPDKLIVPSTRPSMKSDSDPLTSPLMTRDLPMEHCSIELAVAYRGAPSGDGSAAGDVFRASDDFETGSGTAGCFAVLDMGIN